MNDALKNAIIFGSGALIGSAVTFFVVKDRFEAKADEEVESVRRAYQEKMDETFGEGKSSLKGDLKGPSEIPEEDSRVHLSESKSSIARELNNKPPLKDYTKYFKKEAIDEDSKSEDELAEAERPPEDEPYTDEEDRQQTMDAIDYQLNGANREAIASDKPPYVIDKSDFELTCDHYDKISLLYYISDDILCDDENTEIGRMVLLGTCLETSGFTDNDDEILYVRNDKLSSDYEITKVYTNYDGIG